MYQTKPQTTLASQIQEKEDDFLTFRNTTYFGIEIKYPSYWEISQNPRNLGSMEDEVVRFSTPIESPTDEYQENLSIFVYSSENRNLDDIPARFESYEGFTINEDTNTTTIGNNLAHKIVISYTDGIDGFQIKEMNILVIKNNKVYDITYIAQLEKYEKYLPTIQKMIDSFEILPLDFLTYEIPGGFRINYTSDWNPVKDEEDIVRFYSMKSTLFDWRESLTISYGDFTGENITLDEAMEIFINSFRRYPEYNITEPAHPVDGPNNDFVRRVVINYIDEESCGLCQVMTTSIKHGDFVYHLEYDSRPETHSFYLPVIQKMINSFEIDITSKEYRSSSNDEVFLIYPSDWNVIDIDDNITFISPYESNTDDFREKVSVNVSSILSDVNMTSPQIDDMINQQINYYRQSFANLDLIESNGINMGRHPAYRILLNGMDDSRQYQSKIMSIWTMKNNKVYSITYSAESSKYLHYMPVVNDIIDSFVNNTIQQKKNNNDYEQNLPAINVGLYPADLSINSKTNKIYVANSGSNTVSVIDGFEDKVESKIIVGSEPYGVDVNPKTNKIYVANSGSNTVSVIDGNTNNSIEANIPVGKEPYDVVIDSNGRWIYVPNYSSDTVSVIDGNTNIVVKTIPVGINPYSIGINGITSTLYVVNQYSDTVSVIEYFTNQTGGFEYNHPVENITVGYFESPTGIAVDKNLNIIYISIQDSDLIQIINGSSNMKTDSILSRSGLHDPVDIQLNPTTNLIYIANSDSNTVSVINGIVKNGIVGFDRIDEIQVGPEPLDIAINPNTNLIYIANSDSNTVSVIDGTVNELVTGVNFNITPKNWGYIDCDGKRINSTYVRYSYTGKPLIIECKAIPKSGYAFGHWSGSLPSNTKVPLWSDIISTLFGSLSSNSMNQPTTMINATNGGSANANFVKGLNFVQKYGNDISNFVLLLLVAIPLILTIPAAIVHKRIKLPLPKILSKSFNFIDNLRNSEVLQTDASVIVGVLVLLTLTTTQSSAEGINRSEINSITANIIFPFALSAVLVLLSKSHNTSNGVITTPNETSTTFEIPTNRKKLGIKLMVAGFVNLMVSIFLLIIISY
jgi:YVTN family beta-propeller protein